MGDDEKITKADLKELLKDWKAEIKPSTMEPITKADLKELFAEIRGEVKQWIAEGFGTCKPAFVADPLDPLALKASRSPPTTTGDVIPVLAAAAASGGTFDEEAYTATPAIAERDPEVVLPASTGFITTAPATCSMEGLVRETTDSRSASSSTTVPTVHKTTSDIERVLAASTASHGTFDGQAISGVALSPATCLVLCLPRHPVAAPVLVASSPPTVTAYGLDSRSIHPAAVPLAMKCEFYVVVHRPMPWPFFLDVHSNGDETRPLPWPSFRVITAGECPNDVVIKQSRQCSYDSSRAQYCDAIGFPILNLYVMVRNLELKLLPHDSTTITLLSVSLDSGNFTALSLEHLGVDNIEGVGSWLIAGCFVECLSAIGHRMIVASFPKRRKKSHILLLSSVWEQEELHLRFQFQLHIILPDWHLGNQSMIARVSTYNCCASGTCQVYKIPSYMKYFYSGHYQVETYFHDGHLSYHVLKHNVPDASQCSGEEDLLEPFLKQERVGLISADVLQWHIPGLSFIFLDLTKMTALIQLHLLRACERMKQQADKSRSERVLAVGDKVFIKLQPYVQSSVSRHACHKLSFRYFGPFPIVERIGQVAYRVALLETSTIHTVFHVSLFRKALKPDVQVLIRWSGDSLPDSWENKEELMATFPFE